ncbi:hypothetical protein ACSQ67_002134 [Phaseolus vulgaris]
MAISQSILCFITFTCFMHVTKPSNLNTDELLQGHEFTTSDRLISPTGWYTMSFFQNKGSEDFYLGIGKSAENSTDQNFWIANRDMPIQDPATFLIIDEFGNLKIISNRERNSSIMLYSSDAGREVNSNTTFNAILQDTGNLMLREVNQNGSVKRILWQSFDHLSHVLMMGMRLGFNRKTGQNWSITSRRSEKTLLSGSFTLGLEPKTKQLMIWWRGNIFWSSGQWSNGSFANLKSPLYEKDFEFDYCSNENETYVSYLPSYIYLEPSGSIYGGISGVSYSCVNNYFLSGCSMPSVPKCRDHESLYRGSRNSYGVMQGTGFKFDESENLTSFDCWMKCLNNCSCEAYSYVNEDETGCEIWSRDSANFVATTNLTARGRQIYFLVGRKKQPQLHRGYIRLHNTNGSNFNAGNTQIWIISTIVGSLSLIILCFTCNKLWKKLKLKADDRKKRTKLLSEIGGNTAISIAYNERNEQKKKGKTSDDMYIFNFQTILEATANFSSTNKIGEGGFGPVYKGKLPSGQEVAIKRLSKSSGQGLIEFKNEAMLIVKLQHTNSVKLLGFCIDKEERILVYEYLPNKSLNLYLFEILSGKKNSTDYPFNLVFNAWKLWNEGEALNLMDSNMNGSYSPNQVLRYIHIGLLCTQDQARNRPTMLEVVSFLSNEITHLPKPTQPGFCVTGGVENRDVHYTCSIKETTHSLTSGR